MDKLQKISDPPLTDCPACGRPALQKLVSAAGFRLKGGGWYETDFKSGRKKNVAKPDSSSKAGDAKPKAANKADAGSKSSSGNTKKTG
jgi:putative FmdB family regulatory protein